jgi:serine/threonine-protein kinase
MKPTDGPDQPSASTAGADPALTPTIAGPSVAYEATVGAASEPGATQGRSLPGYSLGGVIGRGGMGEVVSAHDERIGRDVAIKRMRGTAPTADATTRFLREARIQARLEHPAIVPVHELGRDGNGQPFFTMKRLAGVTLAELLAATPPPPRQRLLRAFADVCSAVEFAHSHRVVHRDLKPANIMRGDFGEVYVLDWGVARVFGEADAGSVHAGVESLDGMTNAGAVLGTPGYMAPEQVLGAPDVGPAADIYALGSILFEILSGEALHPRGPGALASTLAGIDGRPAKRQPDRAIAPELDEVCVSALALDPNARPTAADLAERVERYLDGDRDLERRRELSAEWLAKARAALSADEVGRRVEALQNAGRALALDPESNDAAGFFAHLIAEPPSQLPAQLQRDLERADVAVQRRQSKVAALSFVSAAVFLLLASWNGLRSVATVGLVGALTAVMAAAAFRLSRRRALPREMMAVVVGNALLAALLSRAFGSLILAPAVTCVMAVSLTSYPQLIDRAKLVIPILVASWIVPVVLERAGVIDSTWGVEGGKVVSMSTMIAIDGVPTTALLVSANVIIIVVVALFANALARSRRDAQRQVEIQAWHLRQLVPASPGSS